MPGVFGRLSGRRALENGRMLFKFFNRKAATAVREEPLASSCMEKSIQGVAIYPPHDPGLPLATSSDLLAGQAALLRRIKVHAAHSESAFDVRFMGPLRRAAAYVGNLPATADSIYSGPGGAFRASLELAFATFQASDGRIFTGGLGVEQRHLLEARWRYVCFLAGMLWPVGETLEHLVVASPDGKVWSPRVGGLEQWADAGGIHSVYCTWSSGAFKPGPSPTAGAIALSIIGEEPIHWLESGSPGLLTALIAIASGIRNDANATAFDLVERMWERVTDVETSRRPQSYGRLQYGVHTGPHLVDAMRSLLDQGTWSINKDPLFVDSKGVYLLWPEAARPIQERMKASGLHGVPSTAAGLLAQLENNGLIHTSVAAGPFVEVANNDGEIMSAVKLTKPNSLVEGYNPADFQKSRPVVMDEVVKADPLASVATAAQKKSQTTTTKLVPREDEKLPEPPAAGEDVLQPTLIADAPKAIEKVHAPVLNQETVSDVAAPELNKLPGTIAKSLVANSSPAATAQPIAADPSGIKATEGHEVRYADSLPPDVLRSMKPYVAEQLGKLVRLCQAESTGTRKLATGLAVPMQVVKEVAANPFDFLRDLSVVGYLHVDPSKPGKLIQDVVIPEGTTNKVTCFVLSTVLTEKVGL